MTSMTLDTAITSRETSGALFTVACQDVKRIARTMEEAATSKENGGKLLKIIIPIQIQAC